MTSTIETSVGTGGLMTESNAAVSKLGKEEFGLALTSAGAISAGAYTAGVMDFLITALSDWYDAKGEGRVPGHKVRIMALSGASAGGMCTALSAVSFCENSTEKFRKSWVERIDLMELLDETDLEEKRSEVVSLLNCRILDEIAKEAITVDSGKAKWYPFLDDSLRMFLTLTNLNGSPYGMEMAGEAGNGYIMSSHADYLEFCLDKSTLPTGLSPGQIPLSAKDASNWDILRNAALATGAFPLALKSRSIKMASIEARRRRMHFPTLTDFPAGMKVLGLHDDERDYLFADGGMTNNEPFGLAHMAIADAGKENERNAFKADRAVLMIDPFPDNVRTGEYQPCRTDLMSLPAYLLNALRSQSRFRGEDVLLALKADIYSRFIIAPKRYSSEGESAKKAAKQTPLHLACGVLGAFGGFLDQSFREHDYQLGRRNCQQFLRHHFVLPERNKLFSGLRDNQQLLDKYYVRDKYGIIVKEEVVNENGEKELTRFLPVIPLVSERVKHDVAEPQWPRMRQKRLSAVEEKIQRRVDLLGRRMIDNSGFGCISSLVWRLVLAKKLSDGISRTIRRELEKNSLID